MQKWILAVMLAAMCGAASAGNSNSNPCGNNGNNCDTGGATATGGNGYGGTGNGYGGAGGTGVGVGVGVGYGGESNAVAFGGEGGKGGQGGDGGIGIGLGGAGGNGGNVVGSGNSANLNKNDATAISGSVSGADSSSSAVSGSNSGATSSSGGNSLKGGDINIGGDTYQTKRNAPGIVGGSVFPTATCKAGFGIGGSGAAGGGLINIATTDKECQTIVLSQNFAAIGKNETACELLKVTKTWARAVKKNPTLAETCK